MEYRGEEEAVVGTGIQKRNGGGGDEGDFGGEGSHAVEEVGRAGFGSGGFVAMFGDEEEGGGEDGGGGGDVECVMGVASCADDVDLEKERGVSEGKGISGGEGGRTRPPW